MVGLFSFSAWLEKILTKQINGLTAVHGLEILDLALLLMSQITYYYLLADLKLLIKEVPTKEVPTFNPESSSQQLWS